MAQRCKVWLLLLLCGGVAAGCPPTQPAPQASGSATASSASGSAAVVVSAAPGSGAAVLPAPAKLPEEEVRRRCDGNLRTVLSALPEQAELHLVLPAKGVAEDYRKDAAARLEHLASLSAGKLRFVAVAPQPGEPQAADKLSETKSCGPHGTAGVACVEILVAAQQGVVAAKLDEPLAKLEAQTLRVLLAVRRKVDGRRYRLGAVVKPGIRLSDQDIIPRYNPVAPSVRVLAESLAKAHALEDVQLIGGEAAVDPLLDGLIVLQADEPWTEKELRRIDEFVTRGGKGLLVIAGATNLKAGDPSMRARLSTQNLEQLLSGYGIELRNELIVDDAASVPVTAADKADQAKEQLIAPGVLKLSYAEGAAATAQTLDIGFAPLHLSRSLVLPYPSPLVPRPSRQPGAAFWVVMRSPASSTVLAEAEIDLRPRPARPPSGEAAQRAVAIAVEGQLQSAFAASAEQAPKRARARLLVIAAPQLLANPLARAGNPPSGEAEGGDEDLKKLSWSLGKQQSGAQIMGLLVPIFEWLTDELPECRPLWPTVSSIRKLER